MDLFFIMLILISSISTVMKRDVSNSFTLTEYLILYSTIAFFVAMSVLLWKMLVSKEEISIFKKIDISNGFNWLFFMFTIVVIMKMYTGTAKINYLRNVDVDKYIPISQSLTIIVGFALGIAIKRRYPCAEECVGIMSIIIGVALMSMASV